MTMDIFNQRIQQYNPENKQEEINAFKEIAQEITLLALSRTNFFKQGAFQGGTCLRIIYGLQRFSEDLDFILYQPEKNFKWGNFIDEITAEFSVYGLSVTIKDRSEANEAVKRAFLKNNSFGRVLSLRYERTRSDIQAINIKLEIDTHPPLGSQFESKVITFPIPFSIIVQSIPSLFAGKMHALLCRTYVKGRDWYDFIWYVTRKSSINRQLLKNALSQQGPWAAQNIDINQDWIIKKLSKKIDTIDWEIAKKDVFSFIKSREKHSIELWNRDFFLYFVDMMSEYLTV
jgi:predicted nucleotidyltransferase component of viral defense system